MNSKAKEPSTAPPAEQWFPLTLGSTFRDPSPSARFYSLRYEFKPASIDTTRPGSLFKSTDNKVTVEFCNNQAGKPKVSFQGNSEECKELDGVVFFDGKSFRLERLHRAVKSLRHMRQPGESAAANINSSVGGSGMAGGSAIDSTSPAHLNGAGASASIPAANVNVEKIDPVVHVEEVSAVQPDVSADKKANNKRKPDVPLKTPKGRISPPVESSPVATKSIQEEQVDIDDDIDDRGKKQKTPEPAQPEVNIDDEIISDYEIEDVDVSEDEDGVNAAEALRAQAAISQKQEQSSSESSGSGSGSGSGSDSSDSGSGSGSGSSSSGSGSDDDEDSASSGDDI